MGKDNVNGHRVDMDNNERLYRFLENWAKQGVLLLNTSLTVRAHQAASHAGKGWEKFTGNISKRRFLGFVSLLTWSCIL